MAPRARTAASVRTGASVKTAAPGKNGGPVRNADIGTGPPTGGASAPPTLALDPSGRPRVMWVYSGLVGGSKSWEYATCDSPADCSTPERWTETELRSETADHS